MVNLFTKHT